MVTLNDIRRVCHTDKAKKIVSGSILERSYLWHRELGGLITFVFLNFLPFVRPNHVSLLMVLIGLAGCLCFSIGSITAYLIGSFLLYFSFLLDKVDGDIARYRKCFSSFGKFLDEIYHLFPQTCIYLGLGMGIGDSALYGDGIWLGIVGMLAAMFNRVAPKLEALIVSESVDGSVKNTKKTGSSKPGRSNPVGMWLGLVTRFDWVILIIVIASVLELVYEAQVDFVFIVFAFLVFANIIRLLVIIKGVGKRL